MVYVCMYLEEIGGRSTGCAQEGDSNGDLEDVRGQGAGKQVGHLSVAVLALVVQVH